MFALCGSTPMRCLSAPTVPHVLSPAAPQRQRVGGLWPGTPCAVSAPPSVSGAVWGPILGPRILLSCCIDCCCVFSELVYFAQLHPWYTRAVLLDSASRVDRQLHRLAVQFATASGVPVKLLSSVGKACVCVCVASVFLWFLSCQSTGHTCAHG